MDRRIVWALLLSAGPLLYVSCSPCVSTGAPERDIAAQVTIFDGGIGDPCDTTSQCAPGLDCRDAFPVTNSYSEPATFRTCTRDCASNACPTGSTCISAAGDAGTLCVPSCAADSDCQKGHLAGTCVGADAGTLADGGNPVGECRPIVCGGATGGSCPSSYLCQDDYYGGGGRGGGCYPAGSNAAMAAPRAAWCGKQ
jgi:hypothetical protein